VPDTAKIAIVAALERELHPLIQHWTVATKPHSGRNFRFFEKGQVVVVCGGIGAEPARRAAEAVIALYAPEVVYSAGFAGALDPAMKVADMLVPARVIDAGDASSVDTGAGQGILVTFGAVATPEQKVKLGKSFNAQAVDMEAAAVARAAAARGVRFAAVKVISDEVGFALPGTNRPASDRPARDKRTPNGFISPSGEFQIGQFARFIMIRPWTWAIALRLARNSKRAAVALSAWLAEKNHELLGLPANEVPGKELQENKMTEKEKQAGSLKISTRL
jgi:adenosylhomocysteine nucleosidase